MKYNHKYEELDIFLKYSEYLWTEYKAQWRDQITNKTCVELANHELILTNSFLSLLQFIPSYDVHNFSFHANLTECFHFNYLQS